jgi:hypothetical protein
MNNTLGYQLHTHAHKCKQGEKQMYISEQAKLRIKGMNDDSIEIYFRLLCKDASRVQYKEILSLC